MFQIQIKKSFLNSEFEFGLPGTRVTALGNLKKGSTDVNRPVLELQKIKQTSKELSGSLIPDLKHVWPQSNIDEQKRQKDHFSRKTLV